MSRRAGHHNPARTRACLAATLRDRRHEIVQEVLARVHAVAEPTGKEDVEYVLGLEEAVSVAVDYALKGVEDGEQRAGPVPRALLDQAAQAAQNKVSLDVVLRRYLAGHVVLSDVILREVEGHAELPNAGAQYLLRSLATLLDRTIPAVAAEHARIQESNVHPLSAKKRRAEIVDRLLNGEMPEAEELNYDLSLWHTALVGSGPGVEELLRALAAEFGRRRLFVWRDESLLWAWLGGRDPLDAGSLLRQVRKQADDGIRMGIGEAGCRTVGWRTSIEQARAAFPMARHHDGAVRYADVAVVTTVLQDGVLLGTLRQRYLEPLDNERDRARKLRETARAYLVSGRSVSSTAAALRVSRQTVRNRLRAIEERFGCPLDTCAGDLELALRLEAMGYVETLTADPVPAGAA